MILFSTQRITRLAALLLTLSVPLVAQANPFEHQLANGLRIIVKEDHRAPTAAHMVWYRAGSMDETNGTTGVAHLLEHMMFKGTPTTGAGEFSRLVAAAGGRDNAFTSKDFTAYFQQVPKQKLEQMMQLEADRMRHLTLDPKEFEQEIKVVMEERRLRTDDQPQALLASRPLPARKPQSEPIQTGIRRLTVKAPAELPVVLMAYKVPVIRDVEKDSEPYALEMLSSILDGHEAARFSKSLIREQRLAVSAGVGYDATSRGPGLFYLQGSPSEGKTRAELEAGFRAEISRLVKEGVAADELARAKAQLVAGQIYKLDSMFAQAMEIGQLETSGIPYQMDKRLIEKLQAVTAEQVQAVARKYFRDEQLTVAELDPQPLPALPRVRSAVPRH